MYIIINKVTNETHHFTKVRSAAAYLKGLKKDTSCVTRDEMIDLCNIFAKYRNKFVINGLPK